MTLHLARQVALTKLAATSGGRAPAPSGHVGVNLGILEGGDGSDKRGSDRGEGRYGSSASEQSNDNDSAKRFHLSASVEFCDASSSIAVSHSIYSVARRYGLQGTLFRLICDLG